MQNQSNGNDGSDQNTNTAISSLFRRKYIIYPKLQFSLIALASVLLCCLFFASLFAVHQSYSYLKNEGINLGLPAQHSYFQFLDLQAGLVYRSITISFLVCLIAGLIFTILLSHRMAGPIVRLRNFFLQIAEHGYDKKPLRFRKKDFFSDLPDAINKALQKIE
jgi:hypothetical protein